MINGSNRTIGTSAVRLTAFSAPITGSVRLKAASGNAGIVYLGFSDGVLAGSDAGLDGFPLSAGNEFIVTSAMADSTDDIWLIGSAGTQVVYWALDRAVDDQALNGTSDFSIPADAGLFVVLL